MGSAKLSQSSPKGSRGKRIKAKPSRIGRGADQQQPRVPLTHSGTAVTRGRLKRQKPSSYQIGTFAHFMLLEKERSDMSMPELLIATTNIKLEEVGCFFCTPSGLPPITRRLMHSREWWLVRIFFHFTNFFLSTNIEDIVCLSCSSTHSINLFFIVYYAIFQPLRSLAFLNRLRDWTHRC